MRVGGGASALPGFCTLILLEFKIAVFQSPTPLFFLHMELIDAEGLVVSTAANHCPTCSFCCAVMFSTF
jgi:hypothetical protein